MTCLTTRAVHIEVAQSLDTESCLAAVTRFIARRGYPSTIISDNGTNSVGAANELIAFVTNLELQAAVYGVCLRKQILNEHDVKIDKIFHRTDSSTILQWLQAAQKKQQGFVANRAAEILENSSMDQWRHVKDVENPADIGTRGISLEGLRESVWLDGPAWLQKDEDDWPKPWCQENALEPEQVTSTVATETNLDQLFDWRRYSTFN